MALTGPGGEPVTAPQMETGENEIDEIDMVGEADTTDTAIAEVPPEPAAQGWAWSTVKAVGEFFNLTSSEQ